MQRYYYKNKKIVLNLDNQLTEIKSKEEEFSTLAIINNSEEDIYIIEKAENEDVDTSSGTLLGAGKMLSYDYVPKNAVYIATESTNEITILVKYSE